MAAGLYFAMGGELAMPSVGQCYLTWHVLQLLCPHAVLPGKACMQALASPGYAGAGVQQALVTLLLLAPCSLASPPPAQPMCMAGICMATLLVPCLHLLCGSWHWCSFSTLCVHPTVPHGRALVAPYVAPRQRVALIGNARHVGCILLQWPASHGIAFMGPATCIHHPTLHKGFQAQH